MDTLIRLDLDARIRNGQEVIIELGSGPRTKGGRICIDKIDLPEIDIVADIEQGLGFLPDRSVDAIHCRSVLEHIDNFEYLMGEMVRVLKPTGRAFIFVPHFSNPYYYSDYTHKRCFGFYTFYYFVDSLLQPRRKVPNFYTTIRINIHSIRFTFSSRIWVIKRLKKLLGTMVNSHRMFQEFYEEHLCYLMPCNGIELVFSPDQKQASDLPD